MQFSKVQLCFTCTKLKVLISSASEWCVESETGVYGRGVGCAYCVCLHLCMSVCSCMLAYTRVEAGLSTWLSGQMRAVIHGQLLVCTAYIVIPQMLNFPRNKQVSNKSVILHNWGGTNFFLTELDICGVKSRTHAHTN